MKELIISYTKKDFRIDTFCSGGPGGQHQNKTQSGVRITHIPTGLSSESRESKHQPQNKKLALRKLAKLIKQYHVELERKKRERTTEVVRTYHAVDNRVLDHASGFRQSYKEVMENIGDMIENRALRKTEK